MAHLQSNYYSLKELSVKMNLSERYLREKARAGELPALKAFNNWYVGHEDFCEYVFKHGLTLTQILTD